MFDICENSHTRKVLLFNSLNLCTCIFKHFYVCENFAVYKTTTCFKSEIHSHCLERLVRLWPMQAEVSTFS